MNLYNTFWKIILTNEIIIPTIQRDYAYGRPEASNILKNLLVDIKRVLDSKTGDQLHLAFVYGKLEGKQNDQVLIRNSENIKSLLESVKEYAGNLDIIVDFDAKRDVVRLADNVKFIPIDGQQRLTTLYLLHWFFALKLGKTEDLKVLKKFKYATRVSSKEFCELLCEIGTDKVADEINAEFITNQEEYFKQWFNDPTVKNMLAVIDQINLVFKDSKEAFQDYYQKLTTTDTVCFDFFDLENFQLTDDLYVKMNSRGKKLTQFENFKAWLYGQKEITYTIKKEIDISWYDMFWQAKQGSVQDIDTAYLQWFKNLFLADYLKDKELVEIQSLNDKTDLEQYQESNIGELNDTKSVIALLRVSDSKFLDFLINKDNESVKTLFLKNVDNYINILDHIISNYGDKLRFNVNREYFKGTIEELLFTEQNNLNWWQVTFMYASTNYLGKSFNSSGLSDYFRIISNLIFNTTIDSPSLYLQAVKSIDNILSELNEKEDILNYLNRKNIEEISFFRITQKEEEKLKSKLCLNHETGEKWKEIITNAELHPYFYGQIGFILNLNEDSITLEGFNKNIIRITALFSEGVLSEKSYLLTRCLLTQGDCFYNEGNNRIFNFNYRKTLRDRAENWRRFFEKKTEFIIKIINHPRFNENNIIESLNEIITYENLDLKSGYYSKFITNPKLFEYCKRNHIREYYGNYYLLNSTRLSGYFAELYTYDWYIKNQERLNDDSSDVEISYLFGKGEHSKPSIVIRKDQIEWRIYKDHNSHNYILSSAESEFKENFHSIKNAVEKVLTPSYA